METYGMITKKLYLKYLLVSFYYSSELVLRQYIIMSNFLIFGFSNDFYLKSPTCH